MKRKFYGFAAVLAGTLALSLSAGGSVFAAADEERVNKGVFVGEVEISGMAAEEAKEAVEQKVKAAGGKTITLTVGDKKAYSTAGELGVYWKNQEVIDEAIGLGKSGNIVKRYKDNKDLENDTKTFELKYAADKAAIKTCLDKESENLNSEAQDGSLKREEGSFVIEAGAAGVEVSIDKSVTALQDYMDQVWDGEEGTVELVYEQKEPRGTLEELQKVQDLLGSATTAYGSTTGRNQNVEAGAAKLDGHLIYPGETFSVTGAVAPFTAENGYEPAPSYESGKVVDTYGGGICQVSTTLYNAVLKSELDVIERHNHTMVVTYVDPSKDAAIAEGLMDFQFANNTDAPIYIEGWGYGGELTFNIYGQETRPADRVVEYISETTKTTEPSGVKLYPRSDKDVSYLQQIQTAHTGLEAVLWKRVTENGETTTTQVNSSTYQASPVSYDVGINSSNPEIVAAIQAAIAANDLAKVQSIIAGGVGNNQNQTESESETKKDESESQSETESTEYFDLPEDLENIPEVQ